MKREPKTGMCFPVKTCWDMRRHSLEGGLMGPTMVREPYPIGPTREAEDGMERIEDQS